MPEGVERAAALLSRARHGLALTGAGVSAESGIQTFRGEGGLWTKYDPVKVSSIDSFLADPAAYWKVSKERGSVALAASAAYTRRTGMALRASRTGVCTRAFLAASPFR